MGRAAGDTSFEVTLPLLKAWQEADGTLRFEGVASSTAVDRQHERMTPQAIRKMAQYTGIDLLPAHDAAPLEELGTVDECWVDNNMFRVSGTLDATNPKAIRLYNNIMKGKPYALSVGGRVLKAHWVHDKQTGSAIRHIDDVELYHVAVCRREQAVNPDTYLSVMAKAAEAAGAEEDVIRRIGQVVVDACRSLWPFGRGEIGGEQAPEQTQMQDAQAVQEEPAEGVTVGRQASEPEGTAEEVVEKEAGQVEARGEAARGRSQSLPGQEKRQTTNTTELWKGVL